MTADSFSSDRGVASQAATGAPWQPIATAPKSDVLLYHPVVYNKRDGHKTHPALMRVGHPHEWPNRPATHWQPLPPPPGTQADNASPTNR
jgi:hypothetical protein